MLDGLLLTKKVKWPSTLAEGLRSFPQSSPWCWSTYRYYLRAARKHSLLLHEPNPAADMSRMIPEIEQSICQLIVETYGSRFYCELNRESSHWLNRDILHCVYSEWLGWKDRSRLDIACVEKSEREEWLTSLTDLRITQRCCLSGLSNINMRLFYVWLRRHKVFCVNGFPVRLKIFQDHVTALDIKSFCPALRSIEIDALNSNVSIHDVTHLGSNLSVFLNHCSSLQEVTVCVEDNNGYSGLLSDAVLPVLVEQLRENSLIKISLHGLLTLHESHPIIANLLTKHSTSLQDLNLSNIDALKMDVILSSLIDNRIRLKALSMITCYCPLTTLTLYLSSAGELLEDLQVIGGRIWQLPSTDGFVFLVATCCQKLTRLMMHETGPCNAQSLRCLYELCPYLQDVFIPKTIQTNGDRASVTIEVKGSNDDWSVCLSHALRRRQYKQVTLRLNEDHYHQVGNLKSMLEPCQIRLETSTSETSLISMLQDLPHLNSLRLVQFANNHYTDATVSAITEHAKSLRELFVGFGDNIVYGNIISDELAGKLIKNCRSLKSLLVLGCGLDIIVAASKLSNLTRIKIAIAHNVSQEVFVWLLQYEKVRWPSTLEIGSIYLYNTTLYYVFNKESHRWILVDGTQSR
eukprot:scaffold4164_cov190-Ochromonas_danica.AAC.6